MQRQKTIAKWLAVLLLLTIAVASYVALNAIINGRGAQNNVAGAQNGNDNDNSQILPDDGNNDPPEQEEPPYVPHYSDFPRAAQNFGGLSALNMGGEGDDSLLDYIYFGGKHLLLFSTDSREYDVKQAGLHIACIEDGALSSTSFVADGEEYEDCSQLDGMLLIVTKNANQTVLRLLDDDLQTVFKRVLPLYSSYKLFFSGDIMKLYAADEDGVHAYSLTSLLSASKSSRVAQIEDAEIVSVVPGTNCDLLFLQTNDGITTYTYSTNTGFILQDELLNCVFEQLLPIRADGEQTLALLASCDEGHTLFSLNLSGKALKRNLSKGSKTAAIFKSEDKIMLLSETSMTAYCSHLDSMISTPVAFPEELGEDFSLHCAPTGELYATTASGMTTLNVADNAISAGLCLKGAKSPIFLPCESGLAAAYDADESDFENMSFGGRDIYFVIDIAK